MEGNFVNKFVNKFKSKLNNNKNNYPQKFEYVFSDEDVNKLAKENKEKLNNLKKRNINIKPKKDISKEDEEILLSNINHELNGENEFNNNLPNKFNEEEKSREEQIDSSEENNNLKNSSNEETSTKDNYSNPNDDIQMMIKRELIKLDVKELIKHIDRGKDILNHNYSITYGDDALRYIYVIRDKYANLIEYFIGFNNEKHGIYNKNIFSNRLDDEWQYLKNYISILEMIKKLKG